MFKIEKEGWPSLECHENRDVLGFDDVTRAVA